MELVDQMTINDWVLLTILVSIWVSVSTWVITTNFKKWWDYIGPTLLVMLFIFIIVSATFLKGLVLLLVD